jgi:hypothetical protein
MVCAGRFSAIFASAMLLDFWIACGHRQQP